jgi:regulator of replication initiation timing
MKEVMKEEIQIDKLLERLGNQISALVIENNALAINVEELRELNKALTEENEKLKGE